MAKERTTLVLSRFAGESITIGDDIEVTFIKIKRHGVNRFDRQQILLSVQAPRDIIILRNELLDSADHRKEPNDATPGRDRRYLHR